MNIQYSETTMNAARNFSIEMQKLFMKQIEKGMTGVAIDTKQSRLEVLDLFISALFATAVGISTEFWNSDQEFEEHLVSKVKNQFEDIRKSRKKIITGIEVQK